MLRRPKRSKIEAVPLKEEKMYGRKRVETGAISVHIGLVIIP
jgi:hypothetical protein